MPDMQGLWPQFTRVLQRQPSPNPRSRGSFQSQTMPTFADELAAASSALNPTGTSSPEHNTPTYSNFNFGGAASSGSFQQPMVPQELWNMPMTFEWDWADMMNPIATAPTFDGNAGGMFDDGVGINGSSNGPNPAQDRSAGLGGEGSGSG